MLDHTVTPLEGDESASILRAHSESSFIVSMYLHGHTAVGASARNVQYWTIPVDIGVSSSWDI